MPAWSLCSPRVVSPIKLIRISVGVGTGEGVGVGVSVGSGVGVGVGVAEVSVAQDCCDGVSEVSSFCGFLHEEQLRQNSETARNSTKKRVFLSKIDHLK